MHHLLSCLGGLSGQRFSTLKQVNTETVVDLVPAWTFSFGGEKQRGQETQPLVYNGKVFVTGSYSRIWALDEKTGAKLWSYEHRLPDGIVPCCDVVNRGAALYGDLVIFGTLDAHLVALDLPARFGVPSPRAPASQPWGLRVAYVVDPSGVLWHVAQRRTGLAQDGPLGQPSV